MNMEIEEFVIPAPNSQHKMNNPEHNLQQLVSSDLKNPMLSETIEAIALAQRPDCQLLWKQAEALIESDQIKEALSVLKKCLQADPNIADDFSGLGCFEDRVGYHYGSLWDWVLLCKKEQGNQLSPYDLLSLCISVSEPVSDHKDWYVKMLELYPNSYKLLYGLANLEYNQKKFIEAEVLYKKVISINPGVAQAYLKIAFIYCLKWNRDSEAVQWAEHTTKLQSQNYYAQLILALCSKELYQRV
jgi:tetratricopeptide (TPR) repeat protein